MAPEAEQHLERLPASLRQPVAQYSARIRSLAGESARALVLFGSAAAGSFDPDSDTVRSVFVVKEVDLEMLRKLATEGPALGKHRIAAPLIMTPGYIDASTNTFPLEFLEIKQNHVNVFGQDYFTGLVLSESDMRHACERELKTILLGMRQALLATAGRSKPMAEIGLGVAERLVRALRGMLWLHGDREPKSSVPTIAAAEAQFGSAFPGIRGAVEHGAIDGWDTFKSLYRDVEAIGTTLDAW